MADHRAEQILAAFKALLAGGGTDALDKVERDKLTQHLDDDFSDNGAALNVVMGSDMPLDEDGFSNVAFMDMGLEVFVDHHVKAAPTAVPSTALNQLRKQVHALLMSNRTLGLAFVSTIVPAGALEPTFTSDHEFVEHKQRTRWLVQYRTSITDPSA